MGNPDESHCEQKIVCLPYVTIYAILKIDGSINWYSCIRLCT